MDIYATRIVSTNRVGLFMDLKDIIKALKSFEQGSIQWRMHLTYNVERKKPMFLFSTHAVPIQAPYDFLVITIPRQDGMVCNNIPTSLVLHEYTTEMQGVDVANQICISYSSQIRNHK